MSARDRRVHGRRRPPPESRSARASRWLLIVCCVAQFMVILDLSIVNVALPRIQTDLGFSSPDLQWVVDAYAITFAGFLMLGGRAADHFGQRRTFVVALVAVRRRLAGRRPRARPGDAGRGAGAAGPGGRVHGGLLAGDHHRLLRARPAAATARSRRGRR